MHKAVTIIAWFLKERKREKTKHAKKPFLLSGEKTKGQSIPLAKRDEKRRKNEHINDDSKIYYLAGQGNAQVF